MWMQISELPHCLHCRRGTVGKAGGCWGGFWGELPGLMLLNLSASYLEEVIYSILMIFSGGT